MDSDSRGWRKSSHSTGGSNNCVEVAAAGVVLVRDTTDRSGVQLSLSAPTWTAFTASLR
jgi:hypothetical protein